VVCINGIEIGIEPVGVQGNVDVGDVGGLCAGVVAGGE